MSREQYTAVVAGTAALTHDRQFERRDALRRLYDAWDAAPADPTEAVRDALMAAWPTPFGQQADAVLVALGYQETP